VPRSVTVLDVERSSGGYYPVNIASEGTMSSIAVLPTTSGEPVVVAAELEHTRLVYELLGVDLPTDDEDA
jgi:hypothetical protein